MEETALKKFEARLLSGQQLTREDLPMVETLLDKYPYFTAAASEILKTDIAEESLRRRLQAIVALNATDIDSLIKLIDPDGKRFTSFYPADPQPETPTTEDALDTFLDQYGTIDPKEQSLLERLIFNPVPDYSQVLAREAEENDVSESPLSEQDTLLEAFLASQRTATEKPEPPQRPRVNIPTPTDADAPLSESLAKIYVKQGRYDKAYEIISQLSLNFPKKSIYFADQLRFLKKLIYLKDAKLTK